MNYLIISVAILVIIGIIGLITWFISFRTKTIRADYKTLKETKEKLEKTIEEEKETLRQLNEQQKVVLGKTISAQQEYTIATQKAAEAKARADSQLAYGLEQTRAELQHLRELEMQKLDNELQEKTRTCEQQYEFRQKQFEDDFNALSEYYQEELGAIKEELGEYAAKREAVHKAILRERELEEKEDFYRIMIRDTDARDIETLRSIESHLFNKEVLNKLIYETFIKRPLLEMEKRVLGGRRIGGIYKITYIKTGEAYIGRSVDIANRWKEHCLSSLNIGTIAHSTFHNVLADKGLQNFTWEVLEEVDKEKQSSREKYWIDFYQTDKQLNQKAGG